MIKIHRRSADVTLPLLHAEPPRDVRDAYRQHADFVWLSLQRMGVRAADLEDLCHDVFMVVHRKLDDFDERASIKSWIFGICMRLTANYLRRRRWKLEVLSGGTDDEHPETGAMPDEIVSRREEQKLAEKILDRLSVDKRAVFVMFELESLSCGEIAATMGVPVGTVYSRLYAARQELEKALMKERRREPARG